MIKLGDKVRFDPFAGIEIAGLPMRPVIEETGTVVEIHEDHNCFRVEYGEDGKQHICFHFCDIDNNVFLV